MLTTGSYDGQQPLRSKVLIDATRKRDFPASAVPPPDHLRRIDERWEEYGLTALS